MTTPRSRPGRSAREGEANRLAWIEHRRILVDELVQHPDVWEYIADQAGEVAARLPVGSGEWATFLWLAKCARETAAVLDTWTQPAGEQAAS